MILPGDKKFPLGKKKGGDDQGRQDGGGEMF
jgi:hypothetical protein